MALLAEAQVFGWIVEPGACKRGAEVLFKDIYPAAGCQGSPGPKPSEGRHFALLLTQWQGKLVGGTFHLAFGLKGVVEGVGATQPRHQLHLLDNIYLDNGKNLYSAGVESAVNHPHSD